MKHCKQHQSYRQERVANTHCDAENDVMFCIGPLADQLSQFVCQALVGTTLHQKKTYSLHQLDANITESSVD